MGSLIRVTFGDEEDARRLRSQAARVIHVGIVIVKEEEEAGVNGIILYQDATKCVLRVFTNLSRTLLAWRRSFSRTALVPGSSQSSSALEQQLFKDTSKLVQEQVFSSRYKDTNTPIVHCRFFWVQYLFIYYSYSFCAHPARFGMEHLTQRYLWIK